MRTRRPWVAGVFVSQMPEYHLLMPGRDCDVIETFLRECEAEVRVGNCWTPEAAELNRSAKMCPVFLAHPIRYLQGSIEKRPQRAWAREIQAFFRKAIPLGNRRLHLTTVKRNGENTRLPTVIHCVSRPLESAMDDRVRYIQKLMHWIGSPVLPFLLQFDLAA